MKPLPSTTQPILRNSWRSQGVTIPFLERDKLTCVHEHFGTKIVESQFLGLTPWIVSTIAIVNLFRKLY